MALQMSPVDAHSENQPPCYYQPAVLLPEAAAGTSSHQVEPFQCQLLECSSAEQVPLPTEQNPVPPNLRKVEQRVTAVRKEGAVFEEVMDASLLVESIEVKCGPEVEDLRGGAASEILTLSEVSHASVIHSSNVGSSSKGSTTPDTHEFLSNPPCLVDIAEIGSAAAISSSSNSLNDAQNDSGDAMRQRGSAWRSWSSNQSTTTFSVETNPPGATYADSAVCPLSTSAHSTLVASVSDEDYCDSKEPLIIKGSSRSRSTSAVFLQYPPIGPASNWHWGIPQGAGLRGGARETSLNNGGSSCGHPPASGSWGGGGTNNTANQVHGQLGAESSTANQRNSAASQRPSGAPPPGSSGPQVFNQQVLPTGAQQQHQPQRTWDAERRKIEDKWVRFVKKGDYPEEEYQALITSLKEVFKKKLILIQRVGHVVTEELISLQKQRIDLLKRFMSKSSLMSAAVQPSNRKRQASEDSKRAKKTKTDETTEAKGSVNTDSNSQVITTDIVLSQHREVDVGSDNGDPSRVGGTESILLNGTNLTTMIGPSPSGGDVVSLESGVADNKNQQKMSSSNKTLAQAFAKIRTMADGMRLGRTIVDRANQLFMDIHNGKHLRGYKTDVIAASCLHIASRQEGVPQTFDDVCAASNFSIKEIGRCFKLIIAALKITVDIITTTNFIPRFCGNLNLGSPIELIATHIGRKAVELDMVPGRSPISVAATAIFMASHASDKQLTKKELGVGTGVADVTIRTVYKLMHPRAAELFPENFNLDLTKLPRS